MVEIMLKMQTTRTSVAVDLIDLCFFCHKPEPKAFFRHLYNLGELHLVVVVGVDEHRALN